MEYKVGDHVIHPVHGIGEIVRLQKRRFLDDEPRLYYEVIVDKGTVWVPVENHGAIGLRRLTSKRQLSHYRRVLKSRPAKLNEDHNKRRAELSQRLQHGTFKARCEVVRDLTARGWRKPLRGSDATALQKVRAVLSEEWAASKGVSIEEAEQEVIELLEEAKEVYAPNGEK